MFAYQELHTVFNQCGLPPPFPLNPVKTEKAYLTVLEATVSLWSPTSYYKLL